MGALEQGSRLGWRSETGETGETSEAAQKPTSEDATSSISAEHVSTAALELLQGVGARR